MLQNIHTDIVGKNRLNRNNQPCDVIAVTSGKGGVGKSTISANLAISLQRMHKKVLLIDADIHLGNLELILGTRAKHTIADVMHEGKDLSDVILKGPGKIDVLPASSGSVALIEEEDQALRKLAQAFARFEHSYDAIVVDTGAGIAHTVISFLLGADKIVLVATSDPASIADAYAVIKVVKSINESIPIFLTVNKVNTTEEGEVLYKKMNLMVHKFLNSKINFGVSILRDDLIAQSVKNQQPFMLNSANSVAANAIQLLNRRLLQAAVIRRMGSPNVFERFNANKKIQFEWDL